MSFASQPYVRDSLVISRRSSHTSGGLDNSMIATEVIAVTDSREDAAEVILDYLEREQYELSEDEIRAIRKKLTYHHTISPYPFHSSFMIGVKPADPHTVYRRHVRVRWCGIPIPKRWWKPSEWKPVAYYPEWFTACHGGCSPSDQRVGAHIVQEKYERDE